MRISVPVPAASKRKSLMLRFLPSLMGGVAVLSLAVATEANAQQAQGGSWAVPAGAGVSGGPNTQGKGGIAILPASPTGKLANPFPSAVLGSPEKPLSDKVMPLSAQKIDNQIDRAIADADARMKAVNLSSGGQGSGNMTVSPLAVTTLNDDIRAAAMIHKMQVQKAEVQGAVELWGAAYDGKRETAPVAGPSGYPGAPAVDGSGSPVSNPQNNAMDRVRQAQADALAREAAEKKAMAEAEAKKAAELRQKKQEMASMQPVVSSIVGDPSDAVANVLIPFVGEDRGVVAGDEIQTYSGRVLKVLSVTEKGVTVREGGRTYRLRSGNIAPSPEQGLAMLTELKGKQNAPASLGGASGALQSAGNTPLSPGRPAFRR